MMLKKLREQDKFSQEQLATMSGISVRTIQRIESGNKASLESLKSIAAVFNITVDELAQEITMIDKTTEIWKSQPLWIRFQYLGMRTRKAVDLSEKTFAIFGLVALIIGFSVGLGLEKSEAFRPLVLSSTAFVASYWFRLMVLYGDRNKIW